MGANPWSYLVEYEPEINSALLALRQREFLVGRYFSAIDYNICPVPSDCAGSSAQHDSIADAIAATEWNIVY